MLTRRELLGTGVAAVGTGQDAVAEQRGAPGDPRLREVVAKLDGLLAEARSANLGVFTGSFGAGDKLREVMTTFLRAQQKFPDFLDVGHGVFLQVYDWHVHNRLQMNVGRSADGRYGIVYLFTRLILRPDVDPSYIGVPYDTRP
jgi:hypothetical protein